MTPAAANPQAALAAMNEAMLPAAAHHAVAIIRMTRAKMYRLRRPNVSDIFPNSGRNEVLVRRNAVESHDAAFDALKSDVITGWLDAIKVESKVTTKS